MVKHKIHRGEVRLVELNPTIGSEIQKTRPALVISSEEMNEYLNTIIIVPLTSTKKGYPTRVSCVFQDKDGELVLDQIRTLDKSRFVKKLGKMDKETCEDVHDLLQEIFAFE
ncbi:mRNA interferase PemK [candidate division SR1 bacterium]|nr:mRNA interferase PemK [candidate division SR1 bacterium]